LALSCEDPVSPDLISAAVGSRVDMPFTPFHVGPALLISMLLYPYLDIPTFIIASVVLDVEPLAVIILDLPQPLHGPFHSLVVSPVAAIALALVMYGLRRYTKPITVGRALPQNPSFRDLLRTAVLGVWSHVILDAFLYSDLRLFYPVAWNPLLGLVSQSTIMTWCSAAFLVGILVYVVRVMLLGRRGEEGEAFPELDLDSLLGPVDEGSGGEEETDEPLAEYRIDEGPQVPEGTMVRFEPGFPGPIYVEPEEAEPETHMESGFYSGEPEATTYRDFDAAEPENPPEEVLEAPVPEPVDESGFQPDIFIGSDNIPEQWGVLGKSGQSLVAVDLNEPHIVFICGKQGSGKGYSIGVLCEMLLSKSIPRISKVSKPATVIVFHKPREDVKSEFWSIVHGNSDRREVEALRGGYGVEPRKVIPGSGLRVFVDPFVFKNEREKFEGDYQSKVYPIGISPSRLTAQDWPHVLSIGRKSGSLYVKKIFQIVKKQHYSSDFGLDTVKREIDRADLNPNQKGFAYMRLETLQDYLEAGDFIEQLVVGGVNLFDLRKIMMEPDDVFSVMMLVISAILNSEGFEREQFVFVINEAHDYLRKGLSREFTDYINYLIRKKRHAGTWLMLDTHFPEDVDPKVIKGSDIKVFHKSDILSSVILRRIVEGTEIEPHMLLTGQALIRADKSISGPDLLLLVNVRPRLTLHGAPTKTAI
jgi:membrane-bound metal-dependent hydrolase YbcI (DUF457 family)